MKHISATLVGVVLLATIGFVFAADEKESEVKAWLTKTVADYKAKGWNGLETKWVSKESGKQYAKVTHVVAGGPAEQAGFQPGDVIIALNGISYNAKEDLAALKTEYKSLRVGSNVSYVVSRHEDGQWAKKELSLTLSEVPDNVLATWVGKALMKKFGMMEPANK